MRTIGVIVIGLSAFAVAIMPFMAIQSFQMPNTAFYYIGLASIIVLSLLVLGWIVFYGIVPARGPIMVEFGQFTVFCET